MSGPEGVRFREPTKPRRLMRGDTVAVVAPASPLKRNERSIVERSLGLLDEWGLRPRLAPGLWDRRGFLAGPDESRAAQLLWAFSDEEIRGIFCLRGGYGAMRILQRLDADLLRDNPKIFVGYSDLTAILLHLVQAGGMVAFHGPTLSNPDLAEGPESPTAASLYRTAVEGLPPEPIFGEPWIGGTVQGPVLGGCLTMLACMMGTPFAPDFSGTILFLEDVNESPYRIDRMLCQLHLAGAFEHIKGVVLGEGLCRGPGSRPDQLREMAADWFGPLRIPVLAGIPSGHAPVNLTIPLGLEIRLDADRGTVHFMEPAVCG